MNQRLYLLISVHKNEVKKLLTEIQRLYWWRYVWYIYNLNRKVWTNILLISYQQYIDNVQKSPKNLVWTGTNGSSTSRFSHVMLRTDVPIDFTIEFSLATNKVSAAFISKATNQHRHWLIISKKLSVWGALEL